MFKCFQRTNFLKTFEFKHQHRNRKTKGVGFSENFFDNGIDSSSQAWFLGWSYGDGSVSSDIRWPRFHMRLQAQDVDVLNQMASVIESKNFLSVGWNATSNVGARPWVSISMSSKHFVSALEKLGCFARKCDSIAFPFEIVPDEYLWDFIRGYFEADGTISMQNNGKSELKFQASCEEFLGDLNHFIETSTNVRTNRVHAKRDTTQNVRRQMYHVGWYKREDVRIILNMMYPSLTQQYRNVGISSANYDFNHCHRKYHRCKVIQSVLQESMENRIPTYLDHKLTESKHELYTLYDFIEMNALAIQAESRTFKQYSFSNSWIYLLQNTVLREDGILHDDWPIRLKQWLATRRYNETLNTIDDDKLLDGYYEWKNISNV